MNTFTFEKSDRLGLKSFCEQLERYLLIEHEYVEGGLVVSLNAGFGAGKTTFINMWRADLQSRRDAGSMVPMPVVLNAWESDFCGDPLLAILAGLIDAIDSWKGEPKPKDKALLREAAKDAAWFTTGLANEFVAKWTGININSAGNLAAGKSVDRKEIIPDFLEMYKQRTGALIHLQNALSTVFSGTEPKVLVFVDELDRCRPDYAVSYLETIKHVFNVSGMVFVLAIDYNHLANSTRALYGQNLNFDEYFRKFCHRKIDIPEPDDKALGALAADYVKTYLSVEGKRFCGIGLRDRRKEIIDLALTLQMRPRQLQEAFRIIGHASSVDDQGSQGNLDWCVAASIILALLDF